ncbi:MAG: hypothetical protein ACFFCW_34465 [Candidatus Hodarchaeota archaeon]
MAIVIIPNWVGMFKKKQTILIKNLATEISENAESFDHEGMKNIATKRHKMYKKQQKIAKKVLY